MKKELLYRFFQGLTSQKEEESIRAWMEAAPENKIEFLKERKFFDTILLMEEKELTFEQNNKKTQKQYTIFTDFLKIAAAVIITLFLSKGYQHLNQSSDPIAMQIISVPAGQRTNLTLPDGTNVWLNARSTMEYPITFGKDARNIRLNGEAYFDVPRVDGKPFIVQTDKGTVEVLGTEFNVEAYRDQSTYEVTLMRGKVKVGSTESPETVTLLPDNKTILENGRLRVVRVDDYNPYRWKEGLICFRNQSFVDIMKSFEKYYGIIIQIENPKTLKYLYTGKFRQSDGVEYALRILQKDMRFSYKRDEDENIIYIN